jgi:excisionase family DNA binding protein
MEQLLCIKKASARLDIKESTLRAWVFQRRIPCIRLGRLVRFRESELEQWATGAGGNEKR